MHRRFFASATAIALMSAGARAQQPSKRAIESRVDSLAADFLASTHTPAVSVALLQGSDTLVMKGYGDADVERHRPATASTVYRIGSITKQFTAAEIMRLAERGKLSVDDPMTKYLPDVPTHGQTITIRRLLNHTSGIHNYTAEPEWRQHWAEDMTPRQIVALVDRDTLDFKPGEKWSYSNTNYVVLGMIIEKVTGEKYADVLEHDFFKPLGLRQTTYCPSRPSDPAFAEGYTTESGTAKPDAYLSMTQPFAAGALCSTARDLVKWQRALMGGRVVNPKSYALMTTPDTLNNGKPLNYGFGLGTANLGPHRAIAHNGGINGFTTMGIYFPDDSVNIAVLSNAGAGPDALALNVARAIFGMPVVAAPKPVTAVTLPDSIRDKVAGIYDLATPNGGKFVVHVMVENGQLMTQAEGQGQGKFPLIYAGDWTFGAAFDPSLRVIFTSKNGKVARMRLQQGGSSLEGPRRP